MATRKKKAKGRYPGLRKSQFALPGGGTGKTKGRYPVNTRGRAANAKARAKQALKARRISKSTYNKIVAKANRKLYGKRRSPKNRV